MAEGKISVTPVHLDLTSPKLIDEVRRWSWEWPPKEIAG